MSTCTTGGTVNKRRRSILKGSRNSTGGTGSDGTEEDLSNLTAALPSAPLTSRKRVSFGQKQVKEFQLNLSNESPSGSPAAKAPKVSGNVMESLKSLPNQTTYALSNMDMSLANFTFTAAHCLNRTYATDTAFEGQEDNRNDAGNKTLMDAIDMDFSFEEFANPGVEDKDNSSLASSMNKTFVVDPAPACGDVTDDEDEGVEQCRDIDNNRENVAPPQIPLTEEIRSVGMIKEFCPPLSEITSSRTNTNVTAAMPSIQPSDNAYVKVRKVEELFLGPDSNFNANALTAIQSHSTHNNFKKNSRNAGSTMFSLKTPKRIYQDPTSASIVAISTNPTVLSHTRTATTSTSPITLKASVTITPLSAVPSRLISNVQCQTSVHESPAPEKVEQSTSMTGFLKETPVPKGVTQPLLLQPEQISFSGFTMRTPSVVTTTSPSPSAQKETSRGAQHLAPLSFCSPPGPTSADSTRFVAMEEASYFLKDQTASLCHSTVGAQTTVEMEEDDEVTSTVAALTLNTTNAKVDREIQQFQQVQHQHHEQVWPIIETRVRNEIMVDTFGKCLQEDDSGELLENQQSPMLHDDTFDVSTPGNTTPTVNTTTLSPKLVVYIRKYHETTGLDRAAALKALFPELIHMPQSEYAKNVHFFSSWFPPVYFESVEKRRNIVEKRSHFPKNIFNF